MARQRAQKRPSTMAAMGQKQKKSILRKTGVLPAPPAPDHSQVAFDNIATKESPVYRRRMILPLTPRAVRDEQVVSGAVRKTPLDALLTEAEAAALEEYAYCEDVLAGNARAQDYCGDRVQSARSSMAPIPDSAMARLRTHAAIKKGLDERSRAILTLFCLQQRRDPTSLSDAQYGLQWCSDQKNKAAAWRNAVAQAAATVLMGQSW